jgi:hypothetical protein
MLSDQVRLACLLERLRELDQRRVTDHERPILEVARASLREAISRLSHRLHDADYCHGAAERLAAARTQAAKPLPEQIRLAIWRQMHDEADIPLADDYLY